MIMLESDFFYQESKSNKKILAVKREGGGVGVWLGQTYFEIHA